MEFLWECVVDLWFVIMKLVEVDIGVVELVVVVDFSVLLVVIGCDWCEYGFGVVDLCVDLCWKIIVGF